MEIDLQLFAQRVAVIAILAGFLGGCLFVLVYGAVFAICDRLRFRPIRLRCFDRFRSRLRSSIVAFRSDAQRRWWFANRAAGGTGVLNSRSSGPGSASTGLTGCPASPAPWTDRAQVFNTSRPCFAIP